MHKNGQQDAERETTQPDPVAEESHEELMKRCDEYLAGWKRAQADYANLLREVERSKTEFSKYATEQALIKLLPAIDQFEVAMRFAPSLDQVAPEGRRAFETWITGLEAVSTLWMNAAHDLGLSRVPVTGPLDPHFHEAVTEEPHPDLPAGSIIRAIQDGWTLNGKLIRPAKVVVSRGPIA